MFPSRSAWRSRYSNLQQICVPDGSRTRITLDCECPENAAQPICADSASWQNMEDSIATPNTPLLAYREMRRIFKPICEGNCRCQTASESGFGSGGGGLSVVGKSSTSNTVGKGPFEQGVKPGDLDKNRPQTEDQTRRRGVIAAGMCGLTCAGASSSYCSGAAEGGCQCVRTSQLVLSAFDLYKLGFDPFTTKGLCIIPAFLSMRLVQLRADALNRKYGLYGRGLHDDLALDGLDGYECFCNSTHHSKNCCEDTTTQLPL